MTARELRDRIAGATAAARALTYQAPGTPAASQAGPGDDPDTLLLLAGIMLAPADLAIPLLALGWSRGTEEETAQQAPQPRPGPATRTGHDHPRPGPAPPAPPPRQLPEGERTGDH